MISAEKKLSLAMKQIDKLVKENQSQAHVLMKSQEKIKEIIYKQAHMNSTMNSSKQNMSEDSSQDLLKS